MRNPRCLAFRNVSNALGISAAANCALVSAKGPPQSSLGDTTRLACYSPSQKLAATCDADSAFINSQII